MTIEKIKNKYVKEGHPLEVYADKETDELRRHKCLCFKCERKTEEPVPYASCPVAKALYDISTKYDMAMMITRCGAVDENGNLMYKPLHLDWTGHKRYIIPD